MNTSRISEFRKLLLILPIFTIAFWLFAQKGCELTPNASPTRALAEAGSQPSKPKSRSLEQASALLRQAADMIDKNDPVAVKLIRQAIAILKQEIMPGMDTQDYTRVSMPLGHRLIETGEGTPQTVGIMPRTLPIKDSEIIPRPMIRTAEVLQAVASLEDE